MSDNEFISISENLLSVAQDNLAQLADRKITAQTFIDDRTLFENFVTERKIFVDTRREHSEVIAQLAKQIKTTNFDLKFINRIIDPLSASQPAVASDYWKARNLPAPIGSKIVLKGRVFDSATNQPLPGAVVTITQLVNSKSLTSGAELQKTVKVKSAGGGVDLKSFTTGAYLFTVSYAGRAEQQTTVYINEGVLTRVDFPLSKIA